MHFKRRHMQRKAKRRSSPDEKGRNRMDLKEVVKLVATKLLVHEPGTKHLGIIHSEKEKGPQTVYVTQIPGDGRNYIALVNGKFCTAIYNVFVGLYYVDDIYGVIDIK